MIYLNSFRDDVESNVCYCNNPEERWNQAAAILRNSSSRSLSISKQKASSSCFHLKSIWLNELSLSYEESFRYSISTFVILPFSFRSIRFSCLWLLAFFPNRRQIEPDSMKMSFSIFDNVQCLIILLCVYVRVCVCHEHVSRSACTKGKRHRAKEQKRRRRRRRGKTKYVIIIVKREIIGWNKNWIYIELKQKWRH